MMPISHGCASVVGRRACLRKTIVPLLSSRATEHQWLLGVPFFAHHDVEFELRVADPGGDAEDAWTVRVAPSSHSTTSCPLYTA